MSEQKKPSNFTRGWSEPTSEFTEWWKGHVHAGKQSDVLSSIWEHGMSDITAWNTKVYRDEFYAAQHFNGGEAPKREPLKWVRQTEQERQGNLVRIREIIDMIARKKTVPRYTRARQIEDDIPIGSA